MPTNMGIYPENLVKIGPVHSEIIGLKGDLIVNDKKFACMCIGPRFNVSCSNITTVDWHELT